MRLLRHTVVNDVSLAPHLAWRLRAAAQASSAAGPGEHLPAYTTHTHYLPLHTLCATTPAHYTRLTQPPALLLAPVRKENVAANGHLAWMGQFANSTPPPSRRRLVGRTRRCCRLFLPAQHTANTTRNLPRIYLRTTRTRGYPTTRPTRPPTSLPRLPLLPHTMPLPICCL